MSEVQTTANGTPSGIPTPEQLGFDPAELRRRYAEERAKRLRADGNNQYHEITGELSATRPTRTCSPASRGPRCRKSSTW